MAHRTLENPLRPLPRGKISYEQFLEWLDDQTWAEWVDGEVQLMSPVSLEHDNVHVFLVALLHFYVSTHRLGEVHSEPFQMKTGADLPGRSPDILFVRESNRHRLKPTYLDGPADLVVEIISAESEERDRVHKFAEYERGGVLEYWLIDADRHEAEFYVLGDDGRYTLQMRGSTGIYRRVAIEGLWLKVEWIWQQPPMTEVIRAWGLV